MAEELPQAVRERLGLDPSRLEALEGGCRHLMFRHGDLVVRLEQDPAPVVAWQHELVRFFAARIPEVPAPLAVEDRVSVWPYVEGRPARRNYEPHAVAAAELLGRLHGASLDWTGGQRPCAHTTPGHGVRAPIHGDSHRMNLLVQRGRVVALIDWEESCVDLLDYELANAVWEFCKSKQTHDFDRRLAAAMIEAYGSDVSPEDLVPLILVRRRLELVATEDEKHRRHTARAIDNLAR